MNTPTREPRGLSPVAAAWALVLAVWPAIAAWGEEVEPRTIVVATSIQQAIDSIPVDNTERVVIHVPDGSYNERIRIDQNRITLRGASRQGVKIHFNFPRQEYDKRYDRIGPAVVNLFGDDCILQNLTIENTQPAEEHAFAVYGQPNRLIIDSCDVLGVGGDTLSLWNTSFGMYYHRNCRFRGAVDFVCPRGWCFIRDSQFEQVSRTAALWHDGHMDPRMKFVLRNCQFDGVQDFWLGRSQYPSQFYLLDCKFAENMADKPIGVVGDLSNFPEDEHPLFDRKYFFHCRRAGGDYLWHADNLQTADGAPRPEQIDACWSFDEQWDPETTTPPAIQHVEIAGDEVHLHFSEPVAGAAMAHVERWDGTQATYRRGDGTRRVVFGGGKPSSRPTRFVVPPHDPLYGTVATLALRFVPTQDLPAAAPRKTITLLTIGDSTVADYSPDSNAQGWGWALRHFLDDRVTVVNAARNGRSSKSFRNEGLWDEARQTEADLVLIQFGHNDNPGKGPDRETSPAPGGDFRANLRRYVDQTRAMGATPVLVTPPPRRNFTAERRIDTTGGNRPYAEATRAVAADTECTVVDLYRLTRGLFDRLGPETSNWTQVEQDRTHFSPAGARRIAALLLSDLQQREPELKPYVLQDELLRP